MCIYIYIYIHTCMLSDSVKAVRKAFEQSTCESMSTNKF